jgi:MSHA biogenesis protein MshN
MSLINKMLQDLEARRAIQEQAALPNYVRSLPEERLSIFPKIIVAAGVLLVFGISVFWGVRSLMSGTESFDPSTNIATAPTSPASSASANKKENVKSVPSVPTLNAVGAEQSARSNSPASTAERTRLSQENITTQKERKEPIEISQAPRLTQPKERQVAVIAPVTPVAPPVASSPPLPVMAKLRLEPVIIEKHERFATAQERAGNEYRKAHQMLNQGRINEAIAGLRVALQEDADYSHARHALAAILVERGRLDEAEAVLEDGLAQNSAQPDIAVRLARIQMERGKAIAARDTLQRSAASGSGSGDYQAFHAGVLQHLGEHAAAINKYQVALRLSPGVNVWWMGLGISLEAEGKVTEARDAFERARYGGHLSAELDRYVEQKLRRLQ